ncbi:MAG: hypothetical protein QXX18_07150 [Candidatus Jordarchaeales archaeon]
MKDLIREVIERGIYYEGAIILKSLAEKLHDIEKGEGDCGIIEAFEIGLLLGSLRNHLFYDEYIKLENLVLDSIEKCLLRKK